MLSRGHRAARLLATLAALVPLTTAVANATPVTAGATPVAAGGTALVPALRSAACASTLVSRLDLTERVGQLLMIGVPVDSTENAWPAIASYKVGGIFLQGRSLRSVRSIRVSADAIETRSKRATGLAAYVAVDQEGGAVQSLRGPGFTRIPTAKQQGLLTPAALARQTAAWSAQLRAAGITMNLAPVADTVSITPSDDNPPIGAFDRQFGNDPATVSRAMGAVVPAMQGERVSAAIKHFPGLGRVLHNTDVSPRASDPAATTGDPNLTPFSAGIDAGARVVMMSSARYPKMDDDAPAVLSRRIVTDLLQDQLGFTGVVMTDDIGPAAALRDVPLGQRAVRFINAGGHLVLSVRTSDAGPLSRALVARATADPVFRRRVDAAANRVVQSKVTAGLVAC